MIDYTHFPTLAGVYLEDSFVTGISETPGLFALGLDAVLTPEHPAYLAPRLGEHHCYAAGNLTFPEVTHVEWIRQSLLHYTDAAGEEDYGNIDILRFDGTVYLAEGDWGEVRICATPPRFELGP